MTEMLVILAMIGARTVMVDERKSIQADTIAIVARTEDVKTIDTSGSRVGFLARRPARRLSAALALAEISRVSARRTGTNHET